MIVAEYDVIVINKGVEAVAVPVMIITWLPFLLALALPMRASVFHVCIRPLTRALNRRVDHASLRRPCALSSMQQPSR